MTIEPKRLSATELASAMVRVRSHAGMARHDAIAGHIAALEAELGAEESELSLQLDREKAINAAVKQDADALLRACLGQDGWNAAWGPALERLGHAVDKALSRALDAELERDRLAERVKALEVDACTCKGLNAVGYMLACPAHGPLLQELQRLRAESDRLTKALERIRRYYEEPCRHCDGGFEAEPCTCTSLPIGDIARAALAPSKEGT